MKTQFLKELSGSAVQLLEGCPGVEAIPLFSGFSGSLEVKSIADDKGWHFCSDYPWSHIQNKCCWVGRDQHPGKGITWGCVLQPWSSQVMGTRLSPACTDPQPRALLCQRSVNESLHPLDSVAHLPKRHDDCLLCKVLWDLLEISALKRGVFPLLSKAQSSAIPLSLPLLCSVPASKEKQEMMVML